MASYMRSLKPGGILAVTIWNKEDPPKSAIRLFTTMLNNTVVLVYSEFGRRISENGSAGTDHGAGANMPVEAEIALAQ